MALFADGLEGDGQTTNATQTEIARKALPENCRVTAVVKVAALSSGGVGANWEIAAAFERATGNTSMIGGLLNLITPIKDGAALLWNAELGVDGEDIVVSVTGAAGVAIDWACLGPITGVAS